MSNTPSPSSRPAWIDDNEGDEPGTDSALLTDIDALMAARGYSPANGQQAGAQPPVPDSNKATDPGTQSGGADAGPLTPSANAPVVTQPTGGAVAPGGDTLPAPTGTQLPPPEAGTEVTPPEPAAPLTVILPSGDPFQVSQDQANYLIQLHQWMEAKPQALKDTWRAIEEGSQQAISKEDFSAYQAWVQAGRPTSTQPAVPQRPAFDTSFVQPDFLAYVDRLEAEAAQRAASTTPVAPATQPVTPSLNEADITARATALATQRIQAQQAMDQSLAAIREKYNLSPEMVAHLQAVVPGLQIIPAIADKHRQRDPFGGVLSEAPIGVVFAEAFETAMTIDPQLRTVYEDHVYTQRQANEEAIRQGVAGKKAAAGSVATAPSAAVPSNPADISKMTPQQRRQGMLDELTELWGQQAP